jgi:hypothetical protein
MYEKEAVMAQNALGYYQKGMVVGGEQCVDRNPTVEENIDRRIAQLKAELANLEESKKTLGPLLPMRISDIRRAMSY